MLAGWEHVEPVAQFSQADSQQGWSFLWNAPDDWDTLTAGDQTTGQFGSLGSYRPLQFADSSLQWTIDGTPSPPAGPAPAPYLRLDSQGGHTGFGFDERFSNAQDRFAIAAFSVPHSGEYRLVDFSVSVADSPVAGDGVEIAVHTDDGTQLNSKTIVAQGETQGLDLEIGFLSKGDKVYVGYGPNKNHAYDNFETDFTIQRNLPRELPLREINHVDGRTFEVTGESTDVRAELQATIDEAIAWQDANRNIDGQRLPVKITLATNADGTPKDYFLDYSGAEKQMLALRHSSNIEIDGQGATLYLTNPDKGLIATRRASNVVLRNFDIDYLNNEPDDDGLVVDALTFTHGTISFEDGKTFLNISPGLPIPVTGGRFDRFLLGYPVNADGSGRLVEHAGRSFFANNGISLTPVDGKVELHLQSTIGLEQGDGFILSSRDNRSLIGFFGDSDNMSVIGVTAYAANGTFVASVNSSRINVIDSHAKLRPGRWASVNGDAVHLQSQRIGGWVEGSTFQGVGDDVMNFYSLPSIVENVVSDRQLKVKSVVGFASRFVKDGQLETPEEYHDRVLLNPAPNAFKEGERVTFYNPKFSTRIGAVEVESFDFMTQIITFKSTIPGVFGLDSADGEIRDNIMLVNEDANAGYLVQDSVLKDSRRHGNYIMASGVHLIDNVYSGLPDQAIAGRTEPGWPFWQRASDVLIQGNEFVNNGFSTDYQNKEYFAGVVAFNMSKFGVIGGAGPENVLVSERWTPYRNLEIRDNVFYEWRKSAIAVRNARNVNIVGNTFHAPLKYTDNALYDDDYYNGLNADGPDSTTYDDNFAIKVSFSEKTFVSDNYGADHQLANGIYDFMKLYYTTPGLVDAQNNDAYVANQDLALWLKANDDFSDLTVKDHSVDLENDGALKNGAALVDDGRFGAGLRFDGQDDLVAIANSGNLNLTDVSQRTISIWFKTDEIGSSSERQVIYEEGGTFRGLNIYLRDERLFVGAWNKSVPGGWDGTFLSTPVTDGWHLATLVLDVDNSGTFHAGGIRGYLDGHKFAEGDAAAVWEHAGGIGVGAVNDGTVFDDGTVAGSEVHGFQGVLDELRVYNRVLGDSDIAALGLTRIVASPTILALGKQYNSRVPLELNEIGAKTDEIGAGKSDGEFEKIVSSQDRQLMIELPVLRGGQGDVFNTQPVLNVSTASELPTKQGQHFDIDSVFESSVDVELGVNI